MPGSVAGSSSFGTKLRLNVAALISEGQVGKLLVCIDEEASVDELSSKVSSALAKARIEGVLVRLLNSVKAHLPSEERVGDVLRDGEEVIAVLAQEPEDPAVRQQLASGLGNAISFTHAHRQLEPTPPRLPPVGMDNGYPTEEPDFGGPAVPSTTEGLPGPSEMFEADLQTANSASRVAQEQRGPVAARSLHCDWEVEKLTPKLREYVVARFREMHDTPAEPGRHYITISLRPRERPGSVVAPAPVHYSIARVDVIEFERLCGRKTQETRTRLDYFQRCRGALLSLMDRGASRQDYAPNMLPYRYKQGEQLGGLLDEVDEGTFGQVEGFRPVLVIDTSGAVGEKLVFVKAALKRMLYSFMVAKSKFNIIAFNSQGRAVAWENNLVPPVAQKLREAEDFIDSLQRSRGGTDFMEAMRWVLTPSDADSVYLVTPGFHRRADVAYCLADIRSRNLQQLPINVIGVECETKTEVDLRRLAEENRGSFRQKHFNARTSVSQSEQEMNSTRLQVTRQSGDERLSIGGQIDILEVMITEQEIQTTDWLEEQKCANRILLSSASQHPVPDVDQARYAAGRSVVNHLCRPQPPTMAEMLQGAGRRAGSARAHPSGRGATQPAQRSGSLGKPSSGRAPSNLKTGFHHRDFPQKPQQAYPTSGSASGDLRRPAVANPWHQPSGVIKVSQLAGNARGGGRPAMSKSPGPVRSESGYMLAR
eukprot:TRINITY_DN10035_c0_g1_i2.p1 TRINITY_DN10035_c0_g1~~TRINITY_DN10035_c0_g1_i2.p1  ORF type:complete len:708 (-),score=99.49 TRINITY_DN10035_c0_g1_i2:156-2279(-)